MPFVQDFNPGDRVQVTEGYVGSVLAEAVGIDFTHYYVLLDNNQGEGWWSENEMTHVALQATAAHTAEVHERLAVEDYPEIGDLLNERPDWVETMDEDDYLSTLAHRTAIYLPLDRNPAPSGLRAEGYTKGMEDAVGAGLMTPDHPEDPSYMGAYRLGWAMGVLRRSQTGAPAPLTDDLEADDPVLPEMQVDLDMDSHTVTGGMHEANFVHDMLDRLPGAGNYEPGSEWSHDWCRFRRNSQCFFPKELDRQASQIAGYAVWVPERRGHCSRGKWAEQEACPLSEPGPNVPGGFTDATVPWGQGGQRVGHVEGEEPGEQEKTAAWVDVQAKGHSIFVSGGVRVLAVNMQSDGVHPDTFYGQVRGDNEVYTTGLDFVPGTFQVASWVCDCKWAQYAWGRTRQWVKYEGRICSHALALIYAMQSQGMSGMPAEEDAIAPEWVGERAASLHQKVGASLLRGKINGGQVVNLELHTDGTVTYNGQPFDGAILYPTYDPVLGL